MAIGLKTQIWNNNLRSLLLLTLYPLVLLGIVWGIGVAVSALGHAQNPIASGNAFLSHYWPAVIAVVSIWFTVAWFFQTSMIRMVSRSQPVTRAQEPQLYNLLENLCISRGITMPHLEIIEDSSLNAFASGVNEKTYAITVTRGLLQSLQPDEIEAVLGHELTHILNRDVRLLMVTVIFTGMIGFAAQMLWSNLRYGFYFRPSGGDRRRGNPVFFYLAILGILLVGYLASMLARMAISRSREYMADAGSVELTQNPEAMMRALQRISGKDRMRHMTDDVAMMCLENSRAFLGLFATHPPIDARIQAISHLTQTPIPQDFEAPVGQGEPQSRRNPWV